MPGWPSSLRKELFYLSSLFVIFVFVRSLNFVPALNFSGDQGLFSLRAWDIWHHGQLLLIGPSVSLNFDGRYLFQGSVIYYFQLLFLLLVGWDPVLSSLLFMFFSAFMLFPLYLGVRYLSGRKAALVISAIYALFPYYIDYTRFLWNPNFQLSLLPILIMFMGLYRHSSRLVFLFAAGIASGILIQFHYQLVLLVPVLVIYYFLVSGRRLVYFVTGLILGFSPIIIFELRHDFYNLRTLILLFTSLGRSSGGLTLSLSSHYFLSLTLMILIVVVGWLSRLKISFPILILGLFVFDLLIYVPAPSHGFRMSPGWSYPDEQIAHRWIMSDGLSDFNIVNLIYDPPASVQKYLLVREKVDFDPEDYSTNHYLYVLASEDQLYSTRSYEVTSFRPYRIVSARPLDSRFSLYLLRRNP